MATDETRYPARIAATVDQLRPARAALTVLSIPFYVLGVVLGVLWTAALWAYAAALIGFREMRARATVVEPADDDDELDELGEVV